MGFSKKPPLRSMARNRAGLALPATIFGMVIIGVLAGGMWVITDLESKSVRNREDAALAIQLTEGAGSHALGLLRKQLKDTTLTRLLRGFDNNSGNTADNGILDFYPGLGDSIDIPAAGRAATHGRYYVQIVDDPADSDGNPLADSNWRVVVRCIGVTTNGARAVAEFLIHHKMILPALAYDGAMSISGNPVISGACGDIFANGNISVGGTTYVNSSVTSAGSISGGSNVRDADGDPARIAANMPPVPFPPMLHSTYCNSTADYILRTDGWIVRRSDNTLHNGGGSGAFGWKRSSSSPVIWTSTTDLMTAGTFCVDGNVELSHNPGLPGVPLSMSIIATGSIMVSGNPYLISDEPSGVALMAQGDLKFNGNLLLGATNLEGIMYGGSNCEISGNPAINGQFLCKAGPLPAGAKDYISENKISGNATINFGCGDEDPNRVRRIQNWYQRIGM